MELPSVKCARSLNGLKYVGGSVRCNSLEDPSGLEKLEYIGDRADFSSLQYLTKGDKSWIRFFNYSNLSGLVSLKTIKGQAYFSSNIDISELDDVEIDSAIKIGNKVYRM